jgi:serine phosphatase RsbU (regulator of sigma subunit)
MANRATLDEQVPASMSIARQSAPAGDADRNLPVESDLEIHKAINAILRLSLEPASLEELLSKTLDLLFSISWIALESKGAVFLVENEPGVLVMKAQRGLGPAHAAYCRKVPFGDCLCGRAAGTCQMVFADRVDSRHDRHYPGMSPHGHYCVPMISDGETVGLINLYVAEGHRRTAKEELFLSSVANTLVSAVRRKRTEESLRQREAQLMAAQAIQKQLLPRSAPRLPGFDVAAGWYPSELVSGDYFDYLPMPDGSTAFVIGDVTGHGLAPALLTASTQSLLRLLVRTSADLSGILAMANSILAQEIDDDRFVTLFLGKLEPGTRSFAYASAGHPSGYVLDASGGMRARLASTALPLSVLPDGEFPTGDPIELQNGDLVLLLTDGVLDARSSRDASFGAQRVLDCVRQTRRLSAREIHESLHRAITEFCGREEPLDDMTAVVIKVEEAQAV